MIISRAHRGLWRGEGSFTPWSPRGITWWFQCYAQFYPTNFFYFKGWPYHPPAFSKKPRKRVLSLLHPYLYLREYLFSGLTKALPPPPLELSGHILLGIFFRASKSYLFLVASLTEKNQYWKDDNVQHFNFILRKFVDMNKFYKQC